ncbi:leucine-rich repeat and immunoglobulin-like domain-containing nogo receptor-interacting protein 4a [Chanos chanos]|uniref:leucine-rich repeat and immunoglobulin-like domain-containing nogo receptor-interacting protein 4a n=1 Tax=Chanos chanos TaxID=29144 RepID=UPI0011F23ACC|nr:leucine-rich repeat and immunoglobulin-like domain-containing nogo receptor-interacting protein 1 [Chanos chanos]
MYFESLPFLPLLLQAGPQMCVEVAVRYSALLFWVAGLVSTAEHTWSCPQRCICDSEMLLVNCTGRLLTSVPDAIPRNAQHLSLVRNRLKSLARRQFSGLGQLRELDLSDNVLTMIEAEAFLGLQKLLTLRICRNRLKIIPVGVFAGLPSLRLLDISENEILVFLDYSFREMVSLQQLEASENDLVFISNRAFTGLLNLQQLHLDRCNLTSVPSEALSQLTGLVQLRLCRLSITALPNNSFQRLSRLRELTVSHCPWLGTLATNSLIGLNLTSLSLTHCNLSTIPYTPLHHLVYLQYLDLSYNPITSIKGHLLGDLLRLQEFHLMGAGLLQVDSGAFQGLAYFRLLNISSNRLVTLEEPVFHSLGSLQVLRLDGNPLSCDCRLLWVLRRQLHLDFDGRPPVCAAPEQVQGRTFWDFTESELPGLFTCRQARILTRKPQDVRVDEGHTVLFSCRADGDPVPSITWLNPQRSILSPTGRIRVLSNGSLEVRYAQVQDSGYYLCLASNAAGNDSVSVSLRVRGFPYSSRNRTYPFFLEGWSLPSAQPPINSSSQGTQPFPFEIKTLVIAVTMGFLSFLSSVAICFVFMFLWSQSKGQIKHTATIDFVPRSSVGASGGGGTNTEMGRFTMKLI